MRKKRGIPTYPGGGNMVPVEVEGGEMAQMPNGQTMEFNGPNHESGGVPAVLPENTEIYSKRIKINGESMADRKKSRENRKNRLIKLLAKDPTNPLAQNTVKRSAQVIAMQEQMDRNIMEKANPVMRNQIEAPEDSEQSEGVEQPLSPQTSPPADRINPQYWTGGGVGLNMNSMSNTGGIGLDYDRWNAGGNGGSVNENAALSGVGSGPSTGGRFDLSSDAAQKNIAGLPWGALGTGLASIAMQLAHGEYEKVDSPLLTATQGLRPYAGGGRLNNLLGIGIELPEFAGGGKAKNWIKGAVNPKHKGYCTPMTKSTCTPRRKAFAMTMKKHHGFHAGGGEVTPTNLSLADELLYQNWRAGLPKNLQYEGNYDLRGFWRENPNFRVRTPEDHLTDKYKLPNHPTFSDESQYFNQAPDSAGHWTETDSSWNWMPVNPRAKKPIIEKKAGGGLTRSADYGSDSRPYPTVSKGDFAGGNRSYPIPTKADAVDALRLAGLHGRADVRAKVFAKYPELKKAYGGRVPRYPGGGDVKPLYVKSTKDPRYQAYLDSMTLAEGTAGNIPAMKQAKSVAEWRAYDNIHNPNKSPAMLAAADRLYRYTGNTQWTDKHYVSPNLVTDIPGHGEFHEHTYEYAYPKRPVIVGRPATRLAKISPTEPSLMPVSTPAFQPVMPAAPVADPDKFQYWQYAGGGRVGLQEGDEVDLSPAEIRRLKKLGYEFY